MPVIDENDSIWGWYVRHVARLAGRDEFLGRFFPVNPTVDMYFYTAMKADISGWKGRKAIQAIGPNVFISGDNAVILRRATDRELSVLKARAPSRVIYFLDDLLTGLNGDDGLPADYLARLNVFKSTRLPRILELATDIVAPNDLILDQFSDHDGTLLGPSAAHICKDFSHISSPSGPLKIILPGTRSHAEDIGSIVSALSRLLKDDKDIHLTTFLGKHVPEELARLPNCTHRVAMPWSLYKRFLKRERFHVALHPTRDTAFNRARSWTKILDHAALGAASLFSPHIAFRELLTPGTNALLCDDPDEWVDAIRQLKQDRDKLLKLATSGSELAEKLGNPAQTREFWSSRFYQNGSALTS